MVAIFLCSRFFFVSRRIVIRLHRTRHNFEKQITLPYEQPGNYRFTEYLKRSFSYSGALQWNNLPKEMRNLRTLSSFKREKHKFTFKSDSHTAIMKNSEQFNFICK